MVSPMIPKVIIHNSISIDGSLSSFEPNMELHYRIAGMFNSINAKIYLQNTLKLEVRLIANILAG